MHMTPPSTKAARGPKACATYPMLGPPGGAVPRNAALYSAITRLRKGRSLASCSDPAQDERKMLAATETVGTNPIAAQVKPKTTSRSRAFGREAAGR